jgi:hypothetical protein
MKNKIKKEYRGLFNKKYAVDREIIRMVNAGKLDIVITDVDTGRSRTATL